MSTLKQLVCYHSFVFVRNIYGDEINAANARSIWRCPYCTKVVTSYKLYPHEKEALRNFVVVTI